MLPPLLDPFWSVLLTPESFEVELLLDELELAEELDVAVGVVLVPALVEPVIGELVAELEPVVALVLGVVVLLVPSDDPEASAVFATPEMRPNVTAAAETVATPAAIRPRSRRRLGVSLGFIPMTMLRTGSAARQDNVKSVLRVAGILWCSRPKARRRGRS